MALILLTAFTLTVIATVSGFTTWDDKIQKLLWNIANAVLWAYVAFGS